MPLADWIEYTSINFSAAVAIALDACILVILKFRDFSSPSVAFHWAGAVGLTHIVFPMIGFAGGWLIIQKYHIAEVVYGSGAILLGILIYLIIREAINPNPGLHETPINIEESYSKILYFWIPVMYVSFDALLSGPGKTVFLERYPKELAWLSFILVGSLVAVFTLIAGGVSNQLHNRWVKGSLSSPINLASTITLGITAELILFSFFMVWSFFKSMHYLTGSFKFDLPLLSILLMGVLFGGTIGACFYKKIKTVQLNKAKIVTKQTIN